MGSHAILRDAWGRTFRLKFESDRYSPVPGALYPVIYTLGADDQVGGTGAASDQGIKLAYSGVEELTDLSGK